MLKRTIRETFWSEDLPIYTKEPSGPPLLELTNTNVLFLVNKFYETKMNVTIVTCIPLSFRIWCFFFGTYFSKHFFFMLLTSSTPMITPNLVTEHLFSFLYRDLVHWFTCRLGIENTFLKKITMFSRPSLSF